MLMIPSHRTVAGLLALVVGIGLIGTATSAPPPKKSDDLDRMGRIMAVAGQKAESDVTTAVRLAGQAKSSEKAVEILKKALARVENNDSLPEARRTSLVKMLEARIKGYETGPNSKALTEQDLEASIRKLEYRQANEKKRKEQEQLARSLKELLELQKSGKLEAARQKTRELAREFPGNTAVLAAFTTQNNLDQLVSARTIKSDKERGFLGVMRGVDKSAIPIVGDYDPGSRKDIENRNKRAQKYGPVRISAKEQAILQALSRPVTVDFKGDRFQDVIEYLATLTNQPILIDKSDIREAQIDYETPITLSVKGVTVRTVLRKILGEFGLSYIVKEETIQIVSMAKARETMTIRTYPVGDLMGVGGGPGDPMTSFFGPGIGQIQRMQNLANLVSTIQSTVEPSSWQINGGPGTIAFDYTTMSLIVKNSAEIHAMIGGTQVR